MSVLLHPADQPHFRIVLRASGCGVEVRLNDVPILHEASGNAFHVDIPVNEWLFQGPNEILLRLSATGGDFHAADAAVLSLEHRRLRSLHRTSVNCGTIEARPDTFPRHHQGHTPGPEGHSHPHGGQDEDAHTHEPPDEDEDIPLLALPGVAEDIHWNAADPVRHPEPPVMEVRATFHLPPPWPQPPWKQALEQDGGAGCQYIMTRQMRALWDILDRRDAASCCLMFAQRTAALTAAYQLTEAESLRQLFLPDILPDPAWELQPFPGGSLPVETAASGRLLRAASQEGMYPIAMVHKGMGVEIAVDAWWMLSGGIWQIIR